MTGSDTSDAIASFNAEPRVDESRETGIDLLSPFSCTYRAELLNGARRGSVDP